MIDSTVLRFWDRKRSTYSCRPLGVLTLALHLSLPVTFRLLVVWLGENGAYWAAFLVLPLLTQHYMLLQRNLVYTGVTRAKQLVVLAGDYRALAMAVKNNRVAKRYTGLAWRLQEV